MKMKLVLGQRLMNVVAAFASKAGVLMKRRQLLDKASKDTPQNTKRGEDGCGMRI